MTDPRLTTAVQVGALFRLAQQQGDFGTILKKGDAVSGAILLIGLIRGKNPVVYERFPAPGGDMQWQNLPRRGRDDGGDDGALQKYLEKRSAQDPDLWIVELDTADEQRLTRLMGSMA